MKKIINKYILINLFLILTNISYSSTQNEINNDLDFESSTNASKEKEDPNIVFCSYLISLLDKKIISIQDIENYITVIENGPLVNPLDCNEKNQSLCKNTAYILHRDGFKKIMNSHKNHLNKKIIINDLKKLTAQELKIKATREDAKNEEKDLHVMDFAFIPPGDYRIFYKLERVGPPQETNVTSIHSEIPYMPFQSMKEFLDNLFFLDLNIPKTYYRFPKLKLDKGFELATTLVTEKLYLNVTGKNPSYTYTNTNLKFPKINKIGNNQLYSQEDSSEDNINGEIIKYNDLYPVTNLNSNDASEFIKKLNIAVKNGDKKILKLLGTNKKCTYDLINKDQYNYIKYLYFKDNYFYKKSSETERILQLEDALFFHKENVLKRNENNLNNYINRGLKRNFHLQGVDKLTFLRFEIFYFDSQKRMKKINEANFKLSTPINHDIKFYKSTVFMSLGSDYGTLQDKIFSNIPFNINGYNIYDLFYNKFIFIRSNDSILYDTGLFSDKNYHYEALFRGYADEKNFNEVNYFTDEGPFGAIPLIEKITIKENENITKSELIQDNLNKYHLSSDVMNSNFLGIRLVKSCE